MFIEGKTHFYYYSKLFQHTELSVTMASHSALRLILFEISKTIHKEYIGITSMLQGFLKVIALKFLANTVRKASAR